MLAPHYPEWLDAGNMTTASLAAMGVPARLLPLCNTDNRRVDDLARKVAAGAHPWLAPGLQAGVWVFSGPDGAEGAVLAGVGVFLGNRLRDPDYPPLFLPVAGPPPGMAYLGVLRVVPVDVVEHLYHPTSPLNGTRPTAGHDDPSGLELGVGTLVVTAIPSMTGLDRFPKAQMCVRRRYLEGLPTFLAVGKVDDQDALPGVRLVL